MYIFEYPPHNIIYTYIIYSLFTTDCIIIMLSVSNLRIWVFITILYVLYIQVWEFLRVFYFIPTTPPQSKNVGGAKAPPFSVVVNIKNSVQRTKLLLYWMYFVYVFEYSPYYYILIYIIQFYYKLLYL